MPASGHFRRDGRAAEGAPLLREYGVKSSIEGSNPSLSASILRIVRKLTRFDPVRIIRVPAHAPVAQLDRVPGYEPGGREFESLRARQLLLVHSGHITIRGVPGSRDGACRSVVRVHRVGAIPGSTMTMSKRSVRAGLATNMSDIIDKITAYVDDIGHYVANGPDALSCQPSPACRSGRTAPTCPQAPEDFHGTDGGARGNLTRHPPSCGEGRSGGESRHVSAGAERAQARRRPRSSRR